MDLLTENMKKELKDKFKALDMNDEHFLENVQAIIDQSISENANKIGSSVQQKTVDEALQEEKDGFDELEQLMKDGILEDIENQELKDALEEQATYKIIDEKAERESLEQAGFLKEPSKIVSDEDIVEAILKQLEEFVEEKKQEIEKKIQKNEEMLRKVLRREQLRASRDRVNSLYQKTRNYKGTEGKQLNQNVESAIVDLDQQINVLVLETTVEGKELQSDELQQERKQLEEEKNKLENMLKTIKAKYEKEKDEDKDKDKGNDNDRDNDNDNDRDNGNDNDKEYNKFLFTSEIQDEMERITYGMDQNSFIKQCEKINEIRKNYLSEGIFTDEEISSMLQKIRLSNEDEQVIDAEVINDENLNAETFARVGEINDYRRGYIMDTNIENPTEEDIDRIQDVKHEFEWKKEFICNFCYPKAKTIGGLVTERFKIDREDEYAQEALELRSEDEYISLLKSMEEDANAKGILKAKKAEIVAKKTKALYFAIKEIIYVTKGDGIQEAYNRIRMALQRNSYIEQEDVPESLFEQKKKDIHEEVKVTRSNDLSKNYVGEFEATTIPQEGKTRSDDDGYGEI